MWSGSVCLVMAIIGVFVLTRGEIKLSRHRVIGNTPARWISTMLLLPAPLAFGIGFLVGSADAIIEPETRFPRWLSSAIGVGTIAACAILAIVIGVIGAKPRREGVSGDQDVEAKSLDGP